MIRCCSGAAELRRTGAGAAPDLAVVTDTKVSVDV
jgi:hypothetical protein